MPRKSILPSLIPTLCRAILESPHRSPKGEIVFNLRENLSLYYNYAARAIVIALVKFGALERRGIVQALPDSPIDRAGLVVYVVKNRNALDELMRDPPQSMAELERWVSGHIVDRPSVEDAIGVLAKATRESENPTVFLVKLMERIAKSASP